MLRSHSSAENKYSLARIEHYNLKQSGFSGYEGPIQHVFITVCGLYEQQKTSVRF